MYKFLFILVSFIILDIIYLNFSKDYYQNELKIDYSQVKYIPAIVAWGCIAVAYYFTVQEPFDNKFLRGLVLATGMYGVYNFTNYSIFPNYSLDLTLRDTAWGTVLITSVTLLTMWAGFDKIIV
jgi:uncharacterized membrane protein